MHRIIFMHSSVISILSNCVLQLLQFPQFPKKNIGTPYVYFYLKIHIDEIENKASGSTFKEASGALMNGLDAIIPSDEVLDTFNAQCNPIFEQQENLEKENQRLTTLRDALLPKLMSDKSAKAAAV